MPPSMKNVEPRDICRFVGGQVGGKPGDFLGPAHSVQRYLPQQRGHLVRMRLERRVHGRIDGARTYVVDGDAVGRQLHADRPHQHAQAPFGHTIGSIGRHGQVLMDRRYIDDPSTATLLDHLARCRLAAEERALRVDRHDEIPVRFRDIQERHLLLEPGVVHQISSRPKVVTALWISEETSAALDTSADTARAWPPAAVIED